MAFQAKQLVALNTIAGLLKNGNEIKRGTYFKAPDAETEEFLLKTRSAEEADIPSGPDVVADKAPRKAAAPAPASKAAAPKPKADAKPKGDDKDLV